MNKKKIKKLILKLLIVIFILLSILVFSLDQYGRKMVRESSEKMFKNNSQYVQYDNISPYLFDAIVSIEDNTFWTNDGLNVKGLGRAFLATVKSFGKDMQGGSSITQQLVKNTFLTQEVSITRKLKEMTIAVHMDDKYSKREILEYYLNNSYFANNCYTVEAASRKYFGKAASDVTISEAAYICAITNSPSAFDPLNNVDAAINRRNLILERMYYYGRITEEEYNDALNSKIVLYKNKAA